MFDATIKYKKNGHFFFQEGSVLTEVSSGVPEEPGVFYMVRLARGRIQVVYIGSSGTVNQDGSFKSPLLRGQINGKTGKRTWQNFLESKFKNENIDALDIYWFVTIDKKNFDLPSYVKAVLLQTFFEQNGCLPLWNEEF